MLKGIIIKRETKKDLMKRKTLTTKECIKRFKSVHGNKYDYSKFNYTDIKIKEEIICPIHGKFLITPGPSFI